MFTDPTIFLIQVFWLNNVKVENSKRVTVSIYNVLLSILMLTCVPYHLTAPNIKIRELFQQEDFSKMTIGSSRKIYFQKCFYGLDFYFKK